MMMATTATDRVTATPTTRTSMEEPITTNMTTPRASTSRVMATTTERKHTLPSHRQPQVTLPVFELVGSLIEMALLQVIITVVISTILRMATMTTSSSTTRMTTTTTSTMTRELETTTRAVEDAVPMTPRRTRRPSVTSP